MRSMFLQVAILLERITGDGGMTVDAKDGSSLRLPSCVLTELRREDAV